MNNLRAHAGQVLAYGLLAGASWLVIRSNQVIQAYPKGPSVEWTGPGLVIALAIAAFVFFHPQTTRSEAKGQQAPRQKSRMGKFGSLAAGLTTSWSAAVFLLAGFVWMLLVYRVDGYYKTPDTFAYAGVGEASLASRAFWAGERPFTVPLAFRLFGLTTPVVKEPFAWFRVRLFTQSQALLSLASLMFLALAVASHVRVWWIRALAAVVVVAFGLTLDVSQWHKMLLSESLSMSLMNFLIGELLIVIRLLDRWKALAPVWKAAVPASLGCTMVLFSFARDTNAYLVLSAAALLVLALGIRRIRLHPARDLFLLMGVLMLAVPILQNMSLRAGERWVSPFANVLVRRILLREDARLFFSGAGAPLDAALRRPDIHQCIEDDCRNFAAFLRSEEGGPLLEWIRKEGEGTYLRYLLSNGVESFLAPLQNIRKMVGADSTEYRNRIHPDPNWFLVVRALLFPRSTILVASLAVLLLGLMILISLRSPTRWHALVPAFLIVSLYPLMFVVWHGDAVEVERHAMQIAYQIRLAVWMALFFGLDCLWARSPARLNRGAGA